MLNVGLEREREGFVWSFFHVVKFHVKFVYFVYFHVVTFVLYGLKVVGIGFVDFAIVYGKLCS